MKAELKRPYIPVNYQQDLSERVASLTQSSLSVVNSSNEFHALSSIVDMSDPKHITLGRYNKGCRKPIRDLMRLYFISIMADTYQTTLNAKALLQHNNAFLYDCSPIRLRL